MSPRIALALALALPPMAAAPAAAAGAALGPEVRVGVVQSAVTERGRPGSLDRAAVTLAQVQAAGATARPLTDADLGRPGVLSALDVVVLPYVACMSAAHRRALAGWVAGGGGLIGLYFPGRDDARCTPLVKLGFGGEEEWAELSPVFSASFLNDVGQRSARVGLVPGHPVARAARRALGRPLPALTLRRPGAVWTELADPVGRARPLAVYRSVSGPRDARARPGAVIGWTNVHGTGRAVYLGFNLMDHWHAYARGYYPPAEAAVNARAATALLVGAVRWAAG